MTTSNDQIFHSLENVVSGQCVGREVAFDYIDEKLIDLVCCTCTEAMMFSFVCRDDDSDDEIDDQDIHKIMIVTQTPPPIKKHDRTGNYVTRVKMTQELSKAINDGLYYYEQV